MAKKIVTLHVDDTSIRLLVAHGEQIKKWAEMPLEPDLVKGGVVTKESEVASKIKELLKAQKVRVKKVIVGLSGLHCISRPLTFPPLPRAMLDEAVMREAKRVLPVPLEQLHIMWQTVPAPQGKTQVYLIAIPRRTADAMVKTLHLAGLKPYLMDLKPLALARVAREATALIVNIEPTEIDIVIMADGVPQPIRTVPFPNKALSWQDKLPMVKEEIDRTIKFYNSNYTDKPLDQATPLFISGELYDNSEIVGALSDGLGYPVLSLSSSLKCPELFPSNRYMVNIGLVLKALWLGKETGASVVNLNALPSVYQPKPISWVKVITVPFIITIAAGIVPLWMLIQSGSANSASINDQLDITTQLITAKQSQLGELKNNIAELEAKLAEAEASRNNFTAALESLNMQSNEFNQNLEMAINAVPETVILGGISLDERTLTIVGTAPSETEVLQYAKNLDDSGRFAEITVASMKKVEVESVEGEVTEGESVEGEVAEGESVEGEVTEGESVEGEVTEGESIEKLKVDFTLILKVGG